ncbi:MAG: right-handed parallel beta-helix repeat-containing protein [Myxococcales bacterium]|nr:right-handed parallel beta-helix repeat-containing protein [Myxococcales bacterium]
MRSALLSPPRRASLLALVTVALALVVGVGCLGEVGGVGDDGDDRAAFANNKTTAFHAVAPYRRLDTRGGTKLQAKRAYCVAIAGRDGIPSSVRAVALNITVVKPGQAGHLVAFARGARQPETSTLNFAAGQIAANGTIVGVGSGGQVCFYSIATTDFVVDVLGYFGSAAGYVALAPFRRVSERGSKRARSQSTRCFRVAGQNGIPSDARAVALNLTAAAATGAGFVTAYPKGQSRPGTSNLNYRAGGATANGALVEVGEGGQICVYVMTATDLIVDINGYLGAGADYRAIKPLRKTDSRSGSQVLDGATRCFTVAGANGIPKKARAVAFNVTVTQPLSAGHLVVRPAGRAQTATSSLNFAAGETRANNGIVALGDRGRLCIYTRATTHYILDIVGYWPDNGTSPAPLSHPRTYAVSSAAALLDALETAVAGDRVDVAPSASINLTDHKEIAIAGGVTITGGRNGSRAGALLYSNKRDTLPASKTWNLLRTAGAKVTLSGVRLRGPDGTIADYGIFYATGINIAHDDGRVEGSELYNWPGAGVAVAAANAVVRKSSIHDNIRTGRGYGVVVGKTTTPALIEHNAFRRNRHAVAGSGYGSYTVRFNRFLDSPTAGIHWVVDMHGVNEHTLDNSTKQAGVLIHVHNNDFEYRGHGMAFVGIRGVPAQVAIIENNCVAITSSSWVTQAIMTVYPSPVSGMSCYEKSGKWLCHTPRSGSALQNIVVRGNRLGQPQGCR